MSDKEWLDRPLWWRYGFALLVATGIACAVLGDPPDADASRTRS